MYGYPDHVIEKAIARKLQDFTSPTSHTVKKCPVYLYLPGCELFRLEMKVKSK